MRTSRSSRALLAAFAALGGFLSFANAQSVATVPVGAMTYTIPANATRAISVPLLDAPAGQGQLRGVITGVAATKIINANAGWTPAAFSAAAAPHYVRILSGAAQGRVFMVSTTANTATELNVGNDGTDITTLGIVVGQDQYEILPTDTLGSLFGSATLAGGASADVADNVLVWNASSYLKFYYNTTRSRWERDIDTAGSPTRDTFVLRPDRAVMIQRKAATPLSFTVIGSVQDRSFKVAHATTGTTFVNYSFPVNTTLGALAVQQTGGWKPWTSDQVGALANADLIQVWNASSWLSFYYNSTNSRWERAGQADSNANRDGFSIAAGTPIVVKRVSGGSGNVLNFNLPYTL